MDEERFIRISKAKEEKLHFSKSTLYKWHRTKKFPKLFSIVEGTLFIDLFELNNIIAKGVKS